MDGITKISEEKLHRLHILENKIKEKYKKNNFCYTNGSKMNYRLYDSTKEYKTFTHIKSEINKNKEGLLKKLSFRHKRCIQVENQITEKKQHYYTGVSSSMSNTIYSINKECTLITQKYKKEFKSDDEISLLPSINSDKITRSAVKYGSYFHQFVEFCDFKSQLLDNINEKIITDLKKQSKFTKDFLNLDFNVFSRDFTISQKELIEYKLLIDYLEKELKPELKDLYTWKLFCRMKSSFILFSVSFYKCDVRCLPTGVTSYYSNVKGNHKLFSNIVDKMLIFKRFFEMGDFYIGIDEFLSNVKTFACTINDILDIYENFDDLLEVVIKEQKYDDYRDYLIERFKSFTNEFRSTLENFSLKEHNYAIAVVVKNFLEDYTMV